ncbi:hypothetical protein [Aquabacterium sp.]|uniref:hypothetical protein n=1 Tax=Aquabacterium sp. TaxID=1872578 RepID=UPI002B90A951|nr:hypothetical protein [Aquabacterium sp.]HSW06496.1 hypothetical protein [Aquabacterium sp.]
MLRTGLIVSAFAALAAGCGDTRHEPVKVIAAPRPAPVEPVAAPPPVSVAAVAAAPAASAPPSRPVVLPPRQPGLVVEQGVVQRSWQPGQPNGNADFRSAIEAKRARASLPAAPAEAPRQ